MKIKVTLEDILHSKMFFYHIDYQLLLPFGFITMQVYDNNITGKKQPIKVDTLWPGKIHNGLVNSRNCPEVKVKSRSHVINKMFACSCMALVWPGWRQL